MVKALHDLLEDFEWSITTFKAAVERSYATLDSENHTFPSTVPRILADPPFLEIPQIANVILSS